MSNMPNQSCSCQFNDGVECMIPKLIEDARAHLKELLEQDGLSDKSPKVRSAVRSIQKKEHKCSRCGWNPVIAAERSKKINAEMQRKEEIKK